MPDGAVATNARGALAGPGKRAVSDLERGRRRKPYPSTVRHLADALGLEGERFAAFAVASRDEHERAAGH